jgi:hypothetical protein
MPTASLGDLFATMTVCTTLIAQGVNDFEEILEQFLFIELDLDTLAHLSHTIKPSRHSYQEIIWVRQGSAEHLLDGDIVEFHALPPSSSSKDVSTALSPLWTSWGVSPGSGRNFC